MSEHMTPKLAEIEARLAANAEVVASHSEVEWLIARVRELESGALIWRAGSDEPPTPRHSTRDYIVAVRRAHSGKTATFPATHLNFYPLEMDDCTCPDEDMHDGADGCPQRGWFLQSSNTEYDEFYTPLLGAGDELVAWAEIPQYSALTPPAGSDADPRAITKKN